MTDHYVNCAAILWFCMEIVHFALWIHTCTCMYTGPSIGLELYSVLIYWPTGTVVVALIRQGAGSSRQSRAVPQQTSSAPRSLTLWTALCLNRSFWNERWDLKRLVMYMYVYNNELQYQYTFTQWATSTAGVCHNGRLGYLSLNAIQVEWKRKRRGKARVVYETQHWVDFAAHCMYMYNVCPYTHTVCGACHTLPSVMLTKVLGFDNARKSAVKFGLQVNGLKLLWEMLKVTVSLPHLTLYECRMKNSFQKDLTKNIFEHWECMYMYNSIPTSCTL